MVAKQDKERDLPPFLRLIEPLRKTVVNFRLRDLENAVMFVINGLLKLSSGAQLSQVFDITSMRPMGIFLIVSVIITHTVNKIFMY